MKPELRLRSTLIAALIWLLGQQLGVCFYNPSTGRWLSRDPVGEPGFESLRGRSASALAGEPNRYVFLNDSPVNYFDPLGLDAYILRTPGSYRHEAVLVGSERFGYVYTDFAPKGGPAISAEGTIQVYNPSFIMPQNLPRGWTVKEVIKISTTGDAKVKNEILNLAASPRRPRYNLFTNNCWDYVSYLVEYARSADRYPISNVEINLPEIFPTK